MAFSLKFSVFSSTPKWVNILILQWGLQSWQKRLCPSETDFYAQWGLTRILSALTERGCSVSDKCVHYLQMKLKVESKFPLHCALYLIIVDQLLSLNAVNKTGFNIIHGTFLYYTNILYILTFAQHISITTAFATVGRYITVPVFFFFSDL